MTIQEVLFIGGMGVMGVLIGALCVIAGAWVSFRVRRVAGDGGGFIKDPKGDVFNIDKDDDELTYGGPSLDEKAILKNTNRFLKALGGQG